MTLRRHRSRSGCAPARSASSRSSRTRSYPAPAVSPPRTTAVCARPFQRGPRTGSSTARRFAVSSTRHRSFVRARGRPLPHPPDPYARGHRNLAQPSRAHSRLNEDLNRGDSGSGTTSAIRRSGHIGEDVTRPMPWGERFGGHFHPLGAVAACRGTARERDGRGLNLTEQVRDGIPLPLRPGRRLRRRSRRDRTDHGSFLPISTTNIDDALRRRRPRRLGASRRGRSAFSARAARTRIDALVHDLVEHSERAGAIVQGERAAQAMATLRDFMFEHVLPGPGRAPRALQDRNGRAQACLSTTARILKPSALR